MVTNKQEDRLTLMIYEILIAEKEELTEDEKSKILKQVFKTRASLHDKKDVQISSDIELGLHMLTLINHVTGH